MKKIVMPVLIAALFGLGLCTTSKLVLAGENKQASATDIKSLEVQVDELIAKYPAFQIGIKDDAGFRKNWLTRLQLIAIIKPNTAKTGNFVLSIGSEMLLDKIDPYLSRTDDDTAVAFLQMLVKIFSEGAKDELVCRTFLSSSDNAIVSDADNERIENLFGPGFYEDMIVVIGNMMRTGKEAPPKMLSKSESDRVAMEMFGMMMETYGEDSVSKMQVLEDKKAPPMQKCNTMLQMLSSMAKLEKKDQAGLFRTLLGSEDK